MPDSAIPQRDIVRRLLAWYDAGHRDLPWRRTDDPYRIWLAEVMLQQTRVETAVPYYQRFVERFPTVEALADASIDEVLALWAGLGYYSRARNLHAAAGQIATEHGGAVPEDPKALRALPGVGRYTAGAILSIAFGQPAPILDGNVTRVLCRLFRIRQRPKAPRTQKRLWRLAEELVPEDRPGDFNQALMEFGARLCRPKAPQCGTCPLGDLCGAFAYGEQLDLPRRPKPKTLPHYDVPVGIIWRRGRLLIAKRPLDAMLGGLWEFPGGKVEEGETFEQALRREIREETALEVTVGARLLSCRHAYSHFRITLHAYHCEGPRGRPRPLDCAACRWVTVGTLSDYPFPSGSRPIIEALAANPRLARRREREKTT
jgi:A/G-specific adenine glycosylase